jgi:hypothetical protein
MEIDYGPAGEERDGQDLYDPGRPDALTWLQGWYTTHTNGDWEHSYGVRIDTIDNPGWSVEIDLSGTELDGRTFEEREINRSEDDWLRTWVEDHKWKLACGPLNLAEGLHYFRAWVGHMPGH